MLEHKSLIWKLYVKKKIRLGQKKDILEVQFGRKLRCSEGPKVKLPLGVFLLNSGAVVEIFHLTLAVCHSWGELFEPRWNRGRCCARVGKTRGWMEPVVQKGDKLSSVSKSGVLNGCKIIKLTRNTLRLPCTKSTRAFTPTRYLFNEFTYEKWELYIIHLRR